MEELPIKLDLQPGFTRTEQTRPSTALWDAGTESSRGVAGNGFISQREVDRQNFTQVFEENSIASQRRHFDKQSRLNPRRFFRQRSSLFCREDNMRPARGNRSTRRGSLRNSGKMRRVDSALMLGDQIREKFEGKYRVYFYAGLWILYWTSLIVTLDKK